MYSNEQICQKIKDTLPAMRNPEKHLDVHHVNELKAWEIDFDKDGKHVRTFLDDEDAERCLGKNECIGLGFQIGQF